MNMFPRVSKPSRILCLIFIFFAGIQVKAQNSVQSIPLKVRRAGQNLVVNDRQQRHLLKVGDKIDAAKLEDVKLLFANRRGSDIFLVVDVRGWSKARQDDHQCGAGEEGNLLWIKLNSQWRVGDIKSIRYESCWVSIEPDDNYKIDERGLQFKYSDFSKMLGYELKYEVENPEQGFKIVETKLKE